MRASWLFVMVLGWALPWAAGADTHFVGARGHGDHGMHGTRPGAGWHGHEPGEGSGFAHGDWHHHHGWEFHRFPRTRFVYVLPAYAPVEYVEPMDDANDYGQPDYAQTEYVPYPVPAAPVVQAPPPPPPPVVRYATNGQSIDIPPGARVTKGSVYKFVKDGVATYTNVPPPQGAGAKLLFGYTEAVAAASHTLYRCVGGKPGTVGYSQAPVAGKDCTAVGGSD